MLTSEPFQCQTLDILLSNLTQKASIFLLQAILIKMDDSTLENSTDHTTSREIKPKQIAETRIVMCFNPQLKN